MPQPRKKDRAAPHSPNGGLSKGEVKKIAKGQKASEYFLPFCSRCTDPCCNGHILATESEYDRIMKFTGGVDHFRKFTKHKTYYVHEGDPCLYLKDGLCSIHSVRPGICRMYPYHIDGDTKQIEMDTSCPASGTLFKEFKPYAQRVANKILGEMGWPTFLRFWFGDDD